MPIKRSISKSSACRGLTFIEINLVVILISVLSFSIYSSFAAGMKIWERVISQAPQLDAQIFFDRISFDLRNHCSFRMLPPYGSEDKFSFASFKQTNSPDNNLSEVGKVSYVYDRSKGLVLRSYRDYIHELDSSWEDRPSIILSKIKSFSFQYYYFDPKKGSWEWQYAIDSELPAAVKVELSFLVQNKIISIFKIIPVYRDV